MATSHQFHIRQLNQRLYLFIASIIFIIIAFFAIKAFVERPTDLGPKLEYIGTYYNSGCTLFFCDSPSSTDYYFATDMSRDDIRAAMVRADYITSDDEQSSIVTFSSIKDNSYIAIHYHSGADAQDTITTYHLKYADRANIIEIPSEDYKYLQKIFHY